MLPYACCGLHFIDSAACVLSFDHSTPLHIYIFSFRTLHTQWRARAQTHTHTRAHTDTYTRANQCRFRPCSHSDVTHGQVLSSQWCFVPVTDVPARYFTQVTVTDILVRYFTQVTLRDIPVRYFTQVTVTDIPVRYFTQVSLTDIPLRYFTQVALTDISVSVLHW